MLDIPKSVRDIYNEACEAPTVKEAMAALGKASLLPETEKNVFIANLGKFNKAVKKNTIDFAKVLDRNGPNGMIFKVLFREEPPKA